MNLPGMALKILDPSCMQNKNICVVENSSEVTSHFSDHVLRFWSRMVLVRLFLHSLYYLIHCLDYQKIVLWFKKCGP